MPVRVSQFLLQVESLTCVLSTYVGALSRASGMQDVVGTEFCILRLLLPPCCVWPSLLLGMCLPGRVLSPNGF